MLKCKVAIVRYPKSMGNYEEVFEFFKCLLFMRSDEYYKEKYKLTRVSEFMCVSFFDIIEVTKEGKLKTDIDIAFLIISFPSDYRVREILRKEIKDATYEQYSFPLYPDDCVTMIQVLPKNNSTKLTDTSSR